MELSSKPVRNTKKGFMPQLPAGLSWLIPPCAKKHGCKPRAKVLILGDYKSKGHTNRSAHRLDNSEIPDAPLSSIAACQLGKKLLQRYPATEQSTIKQDPCIVEGRLTHGTFGSGHASQGNGYSSRLEGHCLRTLCELGLVNKHPALQKTHRRT